MKYLLMVFFLVFYQCSNNGEIKNNKSQTQTTVQQSFSALNGDVTIDIQITELSNKQIQIHGKTNLPTNTNLMLSVEEQMAGGFVGETNCLVDSEGQFISESIGPPTGLKNGLYVAEVVMPYDNLQPEDVKRLIGQKGENLKGVLVENDQFGTSVSAKKEFSIGINASQEQQQRLDAAQEAINKLKLSMCIQLEKLLIFKDKQDFKQYGYAQSGPYYKWLKDVEKLRDSQPIGATHPIPLTLRAAPGDLMVLGMAFLRINAEAEFIQKKQSELELEIGYKSYLATKK